MLRRLTLAESRVALGAQMLDEVRPGWENEINLLKLDIACGYCCIAGQLYGHYTLARAAWFGADDRGAESAVYIPVVMAAMGFTTRRFGEVTSVELREAWTVEIENRR